MKKLNVFVALTISLFLISGCSSGKKGKILAEVNGTEITEGDLDFLGEINPRIKAQVATPAGRQKIMENIVDQELLYQEAVKQGINRKDEVKAKADLYKRVIIAQALIDEEINKSAKKYYEDNIDDFKKLRLSHIMIQYASPDDLKKNKNKKDIRSEETALTLIKKIKEKIDKGEDFAKIAKEESEDNITKNKEGDLGFASKKDPKLESKGYGPLLEKAFTMKVGEVSGPIKTNKGYHLITITSGAELEPYEAAQNAIMFKVRGTAKDDLLARLKKDGSIKYPEEEAKKKEVEAKKAEQEKKVEMKKEEPKKEATKVEIKKETPKPAKKQ